MSQAEKPQGVVNLAQEIEIRSRLTEQFGSFLAGLERGLSADSAQDLTALAELLLETTEQRKVLEKQERLLKDELRRHFSPDASVLDLGSLLILRDKRGRTDVDREGLVRDCGTDFLARYLKRTEFEVLSVRKKA